MDAPHKLPQETTLLQQKCYATVSGHYFTFPKRGKENSWEATPGSKSCRKSCRSVAHGSHVVRDVHTGGQQRVRESLEGQL